MAVRVIRLSYHGGAPADAKGRSSVARLAGPDVPDQAEPGEASRGDREGIAPVGAPEECLVIHRGSDGSVLCRPMPVDGRGIALQTSIFPRARGQGDTQGRVCPS